jgi:hypothetical protein
MQIKMTHSILFYDYGHFYISKTISTKRKISYNSAETADNTDLLTELAFSDKFLK